MSGEKETTVNYASEIDTLKRKIREMSGRVSKQEKKAQRHEKLISFIDKHDVVQLLDSIDDRVRVLSKKLQIEILKSDVFSEVPRVFPETIQCVVSALDEPDEWWGDRSDLTIEEWRGVLIDRHRENSEIQPRTYAQA